MRPPKRRYENEVRRYALAMRLLSHNVRTVAVQCWSGLTRGRVKELVRARAADTGDRQVIRPRGPVPKRVAFFLRPAAMRAEASALASLCATLGALPTEPVRHAQREFASLRTGELLCEAYETFIGMLGSSPITLEYTLLLATLLAEGVQLQLKACPLCGAGVLTRPFGAAAAGVCPHCRAERLKKNGRAGAALPILPVHPVELPRVAEP